MTQNTAPNSFEITDTPYPPRFWWMKRILAFVFLFAITLLTARWYVGHVIHQQFEAVLTNAAATGDITKIEQLSPDIPDSANAAVLWNAAMTAINPKVETPRQSILSYNSYPPWPPEWHQAIEVGVPGNSKAIALARQARSRTEVDWKLAITSPMSMVLLPNLNNARNLANVLADASLHSHIHGDDFEAVERIRDLHRLGKDIGKPFFISHLVGIGIKAMTAADLTMLAPNLTIEKSIFPPDPSNHRPATREQLAVVIHELIADDENVKPFQQALAVERLTAINSATFASGQSYLLTPLLERNAIGRSEELTLFINTLAGPSSRTAALISAASAAPSPSISPAWVMPFGGPLLPNQSAPRFSHNIFASFNVNNFRVMETDRRVREEMRFSVISLSAQLYRADHGDWPATLDVLVPNYLPKLPVDPYSQTDKPIGYVIVKNALPDGRDRPLLFSVGDRGDQKIDGTTAPPEPTYDWQSNMSIQFRDLSRWSPAPTTQPQDTTD